MRRIGTAGALALALLARHGGAQMPPPPPHSLPPRDCTDLFGGSGDEVQVEQRAVATSVELVGADLVSGYTTYRIMLHLAPSSANCYTIYGDSVPLVFPPAYQCATPFGVNTGGTNPAFWPVANTDATGFAQYDSWLTVGITDGDDKAAISSIGIDFKSWDEDNPLISDADSGGAVFWMNPTAAAESVVTTTWTPPAGSGGHVRDDDTMVVAQLTMRTGQPSQQANFDAQGRSVGRALHGHLPTAHERDWQEPCISIWVGGDKNGDGTHKFDPLHPPIGQTHDPPPPAGHLVQANGRCDSTHQLRGGEFCI